MKRGLSLILALAISTLTAVSCGKGADVIDSDTSDNPISAEEGSKELTDRLPDKNMDGFVFNIHHTTAASITWVNLQLDSDAENGELLNDAIFRRNRYIEDRFGCTLNITEDSYQNNSTNFRSIVMSGDNPYDIYFLYGNTVIGNIDSIADFNDLPYINLDAEWWNPKATSVFELGGKQIAAAGNYTLSYLSSAGCFLFNKNMYEDLGIADNIYELVREGKWTTDKFFELAATAEKDMNGDTVIDGEDRVGSIGESHKAFWGSLINGADIKYVDKDEDGYPYFSLKNNEKAISFIQHLVDVTNADPYVYYDTSTNPDNAATDIKFEDGDCLFLQTRINSIEKYRSMNDDFGIVPSPKYDETQEEYITRTTVGEIAVLPRSYDAERAENIGILLEAMAFNSQQNIVPTYKEVLLQTKYARDEDSSEMLDLVFNGVSFDFGNVAYENYVSKVLMSKIFIPKSDAVVSAIETISETFSAQIESLRETVEQVP